MRLYNRPRVANPSTHANNGAKVSGDEVPKKLKQIFNTVHMLTLMVAFPDGTIHDVATKVGDYNKNWNVPPAPALSRY